MGTPTNHISVTIAISQMYLLYFPQMDDNLRQSPQLPPRKLPTLKLTPAEEESNSLQRLSPLTVMLCVQSHVIVAAVSYTKCVKGKKKC